MRTCRRVLKLFPVILLALTALPTTARDSGLTFEDRVAAQEAIERVYYAHQIGTTLPFEQAVPRAVLERKVRKYLRLSVALERYWRRQLTADDLQAETERIARDTRMPVRLAELYAALGGDPLLVQECVIRPLLTDRLARQLFASDSRFHAVARESAKVILEDLKAGRIDPYAEHSQRSVMILREEADPRYGNPADERSETVLTPAEFTALEEALPARVGEAGGLIDVGDAFIVRVVLEKVRGRFSLATYSVGKESFDDWWAGIDNTLDESEAVTIASPSGPLPQPVRAKAGAASACPPDDVWDNGVLANPLFNMTPRKGNTAVWTGTLAVFWGGYDNSLVYGDGYRYDPVTDNWSKVSMVNAPAARFSHTVVWTGSRMLVWGGSWSVGGPSVLGDGASYDPVADAWTPISALGAPSARSGHIAVWTGSMMLIWGGSDGLTPYDSGARYNPTNDSWSLMTTQNAPTPRSNESAVWTGQEMIVWGGYSGGLPLNTGARYDPANNRWSSVFTHNAPTARGRHAAVWTGSVMVVTGGYPAPASIGGRYNPLTDRWSSMTPSVERFDHTAVWTGSRVLVWGGGDSSTMLDTGDLYDPNADTLTSITTSGAPQARSGHTAIWTGSVMVISGGGLKSYGRYDPLADAWIPSTPIAPTPRRYHTMIWTGNQVIIWGGYDGSYPDPDTGARYDPVLDAWVSMTTAGAPSGRNLHSAVWTGSRMVIWGGKSVSVTVSTGGRYDPIADAWASTTTVNAPQSRWAHSAVWTGSRMLVWGGDNVTATTVTALGDGASYDPTGDMWTAIPTSGAPSPRQSHTAVWTGSSMIVWGGCVSYSQPIYVRTCVGSFSDGALYQPGSGTWAAMSPLPSGVSAGTWGHDAVWTGSTMVVWGGTSTNVGARYDPASNSWLPTSTLGAPSARRFLTAVWTGTEMIVWGGYDPDTPDVSLATGGRYDPVTDQWRTMSIADAAVGRSDHKAVWTGDAMIVWGGNSQIISAIQLLNSGGRYVVAPVVDADGDGFAACSVDCDDGNPSIYPGAPQTCGDGLNNDCSDPAWPSLSGTGDVDGDSDGVRQCQNDCNDANGVIWGIPSGVGGLEVADIPGGFRVMWASQSSTAGSGTVYDVFGGPGSTLSGTGSFSSGSCYLEDDPSAQFDYTGPDPPVGDAYYFMIRGQNACPGGTGTYGNSNRDSTAGASSIPCQ